ncbi:related to multidrug resistance protein fnx1 [Fusarium fujikuroi]|uniref:Related to multidrug resistance protein fnx1 n=2 Tax=Fusarium fujikuroi TaxID=5127 RepID=S0E878_GIBF5|nr:related to multidrug resistance protein fnx1 [Fusarium fujikuroi IMI 58289]KLP09657.1 multidrug resistance protein fnx1 [Fusarium fujikuroi]CCT69992.1 related to multidrug resistance protein fnx1 [Fusarium fujikuroi IMI 58289]SCN67361.1 related to multidrug resistance protein fnx1 [Fusarium fujikuroi]SCN82782.1 related to multidrug resistance protein fnx1 [Fusarium fujikuroi]SCN84120.1 related to multidrug resistance protein fnx1 [Fusarium fujikuroi]
MRNSSLTAQDPEALDPSQQSNSENDTLEPREDQPLLQAPDEDSWKPPRGFVWIQLAIMSNVFLYGLDSTITAATYAVISSEFDAANTASWLTTSYLVTSTAFQPLYGRVSDIFGRRLCFFISTITFAFGCLGCGVANNIIFLNVMRALTGFGGGGLMTMATIVNSDMIPFRKRGMYQALQNGIYGFGAISGASFGGSIADHIGWRWCFLFQVPVSIMALIIGALVVSDQSGGFSLDGSLGTVWHRVDFSGSLLLVVAISVQLVGLSLGGNELPWGSPWVIGALIGSVFLFGLFLVVEEKTSAIPVIPLRLLQGRLPIATQCANVCAGMAAYGYLFMLPLFFQVVLLDSATTAGARLAIPSLATPIGGLIAGVVMSRWGKLLALVRTGALLMVVGNGLVTLLQFQDSKWKYFVYVFPANLGQGIIYPGILFTSLASFDHADHAVTASTVYLIRSLGTVWGVSVTSAIVQTTLSVRLPDALSDVADKWRVIEQIRHSVDYIRQLPPDVQLRARLVYYHGLRYAFGASTAVALLGLCAALIASGTGLRTTHK